MTTTIFCGPITVTCPGFVRVSERVVFGRIKELLKESGMRIPVSNEKLCSAEEMVVTECPGSPGQFHLCNAGTGRFLTDIDVITTHMLVAVTK
jgi:hypothetical protein